MIEGSAENQVSLLHDDCKCCHGIGVSKHVIQTTRKSNVKLLLHEHEFQVIKCET